MNTRRGTEQGFSLLERLVGLVVLGLLAGIVAPKYFNQLGKFDTKVARAQIEGLLMTFIRLIVILMYIPIFELASSIQ